jgi:transcription-repair coupling factor (superfamily II helicase)
VTVLDTITNDSVVQALCKRLSGADTPLAASGLWGSSAPILAAATARQLNRLCLYVVPHLDQADDARDDIETCLGTAVDVLPAWESLPGEGAGSGEVTSERTRLCAALRVGSKSARQSLHIIVAPIQALLQPAPSTKALDANSLTLSVGDKRSPEEIIAFLTDRGLSRHDQVDEPGDFALRGGILDVFSGSDTDPWRIEFFGDQIESIRQFEAGTQRSLRTEKQAHIALAIDGRKLRGDDGTTFLEYLPDSTLVFLEEPVDIAEIGRTILERLGNPIGYYLVDDVLRGLSRHAQLHLSRFPVASVADASSMKVRCESLPEFEPKATDAIAQLADLARDSHVEVFCDNRGEEERLQELLAQFAAEDPKAHSQVNIHTHIGTIHHGFRWHMSAPATQSSLCVIPHHELFRRYTQKRKLRKTTASRPIESFLDLAEGDYVVHMSHGIGRFVGMRTMKKGDSRTSEEFLTIGFADSATVHVPVAQIDLVQKYIGAKAARPQLSKLGGTRWQTTKARVEEAVGDMAADLLRIQAVRESQPGLAFPQDTHWQNEFETAFLYTETPDQLTALADIKKDMTRARPMDRLLCGDVGYGKTELAMRAAFKAVEFGKQVAVLVPTTVLAEQHYRTFRERMAGYPFVVECISRFKTAKQAKDIVTAAKRGQIDVLIGTHRILSKDVGFADLGLVVVDEEQRFGVEHKERLKMLRATVDVLTLTATPIPRTLHMSMIGLRDISSLSTPPMDRRSIATTVGVWSDELIREAIVRELNRDGQIFFVHNRIHSLQGVVARIATLVPEARIVVGHGQMPGDELEDVMLKFVKREADILVSTSIIESGLDIPAANTIFIDRADNFGLADLHQLRGRVGRYKHRAYCYLLLSPNRPLTSTAARRLKSIEEFSDLGAGFRIAMRDLEIRGAGNILGAEQSGNIAAVGYELYCQLLEKSVKGMRGEHISERVAVNVELGVEAYIPKGYIQSDRQRMECYRRFAACHTPDDVALLDRDLLDAFGKYPPTVETMLTLADIKVRAAAWNILTIVKREPDLVFTIEGEMKKIEPLFVGAAGSVRVPDGRTLHWRVPENYLPSDTLIRVLRNLFVRAEKEKRLPA